MRNSKKIQLQSYFTSLNSKILLILLIPLLLQLANQPLEAQQQTKRLKSPEAASIFAFFGTGGLITIGAALDNSTASVAFASGGLALGPLVGYAYMGNTVAGLRYAGLRTFILGGSILATHIICSTGDCSLGLFDSESGDQFETALGVLSVGIGVTAIMNIVDTFSVYRRVEKYGKEIALSPAYFHHANTVGLRARWSF